MKRETGRTISSREVDYSPQSRYISKVIVLPPGLSEKFDRPIVRVREWEKG